MNQISGLQVENNLKIMSNIQRKDDKPISFKQTLTNLLQEVNDLQVDAKQSVDKFLNGEITDVHQVMIAAEKASIGLELTLAIRNKLLDAYREVMRIHG